MKRCLLSLLVLFLLPMSYLIVNAQRKSIELGVVEDRLVRFIGEDFPTWTRKEVSPIQGSADVIINQWTHDHNQVRVTIIQYASGEQAIERIREFAADMKAKKKVPEEGDEEYFLGSGNNSVILRKGVFIVDVTISAEANDQKELLKRFTRLAVKAIKQ